MDWQGLSVEAAIQGVPSPPNPFPSPDDYESEMIHEKRLVD